MSKGRDKQGREQKKPKKSKKQAQDVMSSVPLRHHSIGSGATPPPRPPDQAEAS